MSTGDQDYRLYQEIGHQWKDASGDYDVTTTAAPGTGGWEYHQQPLQQMGPGQPIPQQGQLGAQLGSLMGTVVSGPEISDELKAQLKKEIVEELLARLKKEHMEPEDRELQAIIDQEVKRLGGK